MNFLAYNSRTQRLSEPFSLQSLAQKEGIEFAGTQIMFDVEELEIWKSTGYKDSKGEEIFENYIVRDRAGNFYAVIWYKNGMKISNGVGLQDVENWSEFTVEGNKFSNPELYEKLKWN